MIDIEIPGGAVLKIAHLVLDYNGTIALDGDLIEGVTELLNLLAKDVQIHVLTADTHGTVKEKVAGISCHLQVIGEGAQDKQKGEYVKSLGEKHVAAIGNGRNDAIMLAIAVLGISVVQNEGASPAAITASDICCKDIWDALQLMLRPERLQATLRN